MEIRIEPELVARVARATEGQVKAAQTGVGEVTQALDAMVAALGAASGGVASQVARIRVSGRDSGKAACGHALEMVAALKQGADDFQKYDDEAAEEFKRLSHMLAIGSAPRDAETPDVILGRVYR